MTKNIPTQIPKSKSKWRLEIVGDYWLDGAAKIPVNGVGGKERRVFIVWCNGSISYADCFEGSLPQNGIKQKM